MMEQWNSGSMERWNRRTEYSIIPSFQLSRAICLLILATCSRSVMALEPNEVLVIVNGAQAESTRLGRYYCEKRGVPAENVFSFSLGGTLRDTISRRDYDNCLAGPLRRALLARKDADNIRCLLTVYGVPFKVGRRDPMPGGEARVKELRILLQQEQDAVTQLETQKLTGSTEHTNRTRRMAQLRMEIDRIMGADTEASVDSELSMVLCPGYDLYRWQPNLLQASMGERGRPPYKTLMVCRLDGPNYSIARGLVDKALAAEANGLVGSACIDSRGIANNDAYSLYDQSLRDLARLTRMRTRLPVKEETTGALFPPGSCPRTALYCGWYSLRHYVPAFDFVDGAIGFHIASFEAAHLRDPNSTEWCPALLRAGITATLGPVREPYLYAFPRPAAFFGELFNGDCLVEAFYRTKPFNSWQLVLIGDPLYTPFKPSGASLRPEDSASKTGSNDKN
jgi:uncharacterized protein (TIGR03790 family)